MAYRRTYRRRSYGMRRSTAYRPYRRRSYRRGSYRGRGRYSAPFSGTRYGRRVYRVGGRRW